jgi:hypothetical protein
MHGGEPVAGRPRREVLVHFGLGQRPAVERHLVDLAGEPEGADSARSARETGVGPAVPMNASLRSRWSTTGPVMVPTTLPSR